ncbi:MAG: hypothetical protein BWY24_00739 [Microgenomates group bacterium ADurb.Bin219]|nr:MAG: hypothetical protein BWY24_00739 [Microgenomates group bacterium ADurb.Bin219]
MEIQSINPTRKERRDRLVDNAIEAYQTLFRSVLERTQREIIPERIKKGMQMKKKRDEYGKNQRV